MLTKEDYITLQQWEYNLRLAKTRVLRNPNREAIETMREIYKRATGQERRQPPRCASCILAFLTEVAELYFNYQLEVETQPKKQTKTRKKA